MTHTARKRLGILLCFTSVAIVASAWVWGKPGSAPYTDNAYIRSDLTSISSKVSGYVDAVSVDDNQTVSIGDVLFRIDDRDFRAKVAQAEANILATEARLTNVDAEIELQKAIISQTEAQHLSASAELAFSRRAAKRRRELLHNQTISQAQLDESETAELRAEAALTAAAASVKAQKQRITVLETQRDAAKASVMQAQAALELAQIDLDNTVVRAPVNGVIGNRQVRVGRLVAPGATLLDIVPISHIWIVANFKETQIENIRTGQRAKITVDSYPDETFEGTVDSFAPGSGSSFSLLPPDNATGNFIRVVQRIPVKIRINGNFNPGHLVPGMSARVQLEQHQI